MGVGATPQGLKTTNICDFQGSFEPILLTQFFHRLFDTTIYFFLFYLSEEKLPAQEPFFLPDSYPLFLLLYWACPNRTLLANIVGAAMFDTLNNVV